MNLGETGTLSNSQCNLDVGASSVTGTGTNLTLNLALSFNSNWAGIRQMFGWAMDSAGQISGWQSLGSWITFNLTGNAPTAVSVVPNSGSALHQTLSYTYSDDNGATWIGSVQNVINSSLAWANSCSTFYDNGSKVIYLLNDAGTSWGTSMVMGQPGTLSNTQCSLNVGTSSAVPSGNNLTLNLDLTFLSPAFAGTKNLYTSVQDQQGLDSGWQMPGSWTVP
jgi:hypothetical protein